MVKKIMILGAGRGQIPFIELSNKLGLKTIVVSPKGDYPGFKYADKSYYFDTRDKEEILKVAQIEKIDAITTDQTDVSVPTVAFVAEQMGLRGIGSDTADKFTNKYEMRKAAQSIGINVPPFGMANNLNDAATIAKEIGFPLIIKPVDTSGSRGVCRLDSLKDLHIFFYKALQYSKLGNIIIEKFIEGKEFLADGYSIDNNHITLDIGIKDYFNLKNHYISKYCIFSSTNNKNDDIFVDIENINDKLVNGLGLNFGITHCEYIYNYYEKKIYLVECAARGGGVYLSSHLTPWSTGFNTNEALLKFLAFGEKTYITKKHLKANVSAWLCFGLPNGVIDSINGINQIKMIEGVKEVFLDDLYVGKRVFELTNDSDKYGPILILSDSIDKCTKIFNNVKNTLKITVKTPDGRIEKMVW